MTLGPGGGQAARGAGEHGPTAPPFSGRPTMEECRRGRGKRTSQLHTPGTTGPVLRTARLCFASLDLVPRGGPLRNPEKPADAARTRLVVTAAHCVRPSLVALCSCSDPLPARPAARRALSGKRLLGPLHCPSGEHSLAREPVILGTGGPEAVGDRKCGGCSSSDKSRDKIAFPGTSFWGKNNGWE